VVLLLALVKLDYNLTSTLGTIKLVPIKGPHDHSPERAKQLTGLLSKRFVVDTTTKHLDVVTMVLIIIRDLFCFFLNSCP
jgi:hypothetical protein